jgi:predicted dehydrogenase
MIRLGYLGSGPISHFHFPALEAAGFKICLLWSGRQSKRARDFAALVDAHYCSSDEDFIERSSDVDAFVIALNTAVTPSWLIKVAALRKPVLCEKPGGLSGTQLRLARLAFADDIIVRFAYNRRFYQSVIRLRNQIHAVDYSSAVFIWPDTKRGETQFIENGCHAIDLLLFLFGELEVTSKWGTLSDGVTATLRDRAGRTIVFVDPWGTPRNAELIVFSKEVVHTLKPLEVYSLSTAMTVVEPSSEFPLRRYLPNVVEEVITEPCEFKPGFYEQYVDFRRCIEGKGQSVLPDFSGAIRVMDLIDEIRLGISA